MPRGATATASKPGGVFGLLQAWMVFATSAIAVVCAFAGLLVFHAQDGAEAVCIAAIAIVLVGMFQGHGLGAAVASMLAMLGAPDASKIGAVLTALSGTVLPPVAPQPAADPAALPGASGNTARAPGA